MPRSQAGIPANPDFNGATQEGVGYYQTHHQPRAALVERTGLSERRAAAPEPHHRHLGACHARC